jgi:hypothetical protein
VVRVARILVVAGFVAACSIGPDPVVTCDDIRITPPSPLTCEDAVDAATGALPLGLPRPTRINFYYGMYCPPGVYCPIVPSEHGVIYFEFPEGIPDLYVEVAAVGDSVEVRTEPTEVSP